MTTHITMTETPTHEEPIIQFLNKKGILWEPIGICVKNGKKVPTRIGDYMPKTNDYELSLEEIQRRQKFIDESAYIAIFTNVVQQIDIDEELYIFDVKAPYFESVTKKLPHYFFNLEGARKSQKRFQFSGADMLNSQWSYARKDAIIREPNVPIPTIKLSYFEQQDSKYKEFKELLELTKKYLRENNKVPYSIWFNISVALYNTVQYLEFKDPTRWVHNFFLTLGVGTYDESAQNLVRTLCDTAQKYKYSINYLKQITDFKGNINSNELNNVQESTIPEYNSYGSSSDLTDREIAELIFNDHKKEIINNCGTLYAYYKHKWSTDITEIFKQWIAYSKINIRKDPKLHPLYVHDLTNKWIHYITQLKTFAIGELPIVDVLDKTQDILLFNDGYYDFRENKFIRHEETDRIIYNTFKIDRNIPTSHTPELINEIADAVRNIFDNDDELLDETMSFFCRALSGHVEDKVFMFLIGERNSGKGYISDTLLLPFKEVIGAAQAHDLTNKVKSLESSERKFGFMKTYTENLLTFASEIPPGVDLDGTVMKSIASGGDTVTYRSAYGTLQKKPIRALTVWTANTTPSFQPVDARENALLCYMPSKFVDNVPEDEIIRGFALKKSDTDIKSRHRQNNYQDACVMYVLSFYKSNKPSYTKLTAMNKEDFANTVEEEDLGEKLGESILKVVEFTHNYDDRVKFRDLQNKIKTIYPKATTFKISKFLQSYKIPKKTMNVFKITIRNGVFYTGMKFKEPEEEDNPFD